MREFSVPPLVPPTTSTLPSLLLDAAREEPGAALYARQSGDGWVDVSAQAFLDDVRMVAKGLVAAGIQPGDRVALMAQTRYEWSLADFAIWFAGAVTVPVYETSSADQVAWMLADSDAIAALVESRRHGEVVAQVRDQLPRLRDVWTIDAGAIDELRTAGAGVDDELLEQRRTAATPQDLATVIYTSGTTGRPKGVELTHANFVDLATNAAARMHDVVGVEGASTLLFLPLAHIFARFIQVLCVASRARLGHAGDLRRLTDDLGTFQPTFLLAVPRVLEKLFNSAEQRAVAAGKGKVFRAAATTAEEWSRSLDRGGPTLLLRARHVLFDRLVYRRLREVLGGRVRYAVSGGAPLGERMAHFYRGTGLVVLEGYGLTETTAPATVNVPELSKLGTVGKPLPGVRIEVADDGEILVGGVGVMKEYLGNPEATAEALHDGWFHTGDIGELDDEGYLRITGRKKDLIVTAAGKNVAPAVLEDQLRAHAVVSQCMVVGDQRPFIAALVTLDAEMLPTWLQNRGKAPLDVARAAKDPDVIATVQEAVDAANTAVSRAESIRRFAILPVDFTVDNGYLTPSMRVKRFLVGHDFAAEIDALYGGPPKS